MSYAFRLAWPPSVNTCWRKNARVTYLTERGKAYRRQAIADIRESLGGVDAITSRVSVMLELTPPDRRKRDIDNHAKAPLDAIEKAGLLANDELIDVLVIKRLGVCAPGCCDVVIEELG